MNADLRALLAATAAEERTVADPLDVPALLARAHRRRTVRGTAYSAVGVGVAAAITLGVVSADGLWRHEQPVAPPATEAPPAPSAPAPTQTAGPATAVPLPEDAFEPAWEACGSTFSADGIGGYQADDDSWLRVTDDEQDRLPTEAPLHLAGTVTSSVDRGDVDVRLVSAFVLAVGPEDGSSVVVGIHAAPLEVAASGALPADGGLALPPATLPFTSCAASPLAGGDGARDRPLDPAGWYTVAVVAELTTADGDVLTFVSDVATMGQAPQATPPEPTVPMTGSSLRVPADRSRNSTTTTGAEYWCGATAQHGVGSTDAPQVASGGAAYRESGELIVRASLTNTGAAAVANSWLAYPSFSVVRDGRQIGAASYDGSVLLPAEWSPGSTLELEMSAGQWTCTLMNGEPWPGGEYGLVFTAWLAGPQAFPGDVGALIEAGPFPFTLE